MTFSRRCCRKATYLTCTWMSANVAKRGSARSANDAFPVTELEHISYSHQASMRCDGKTACLLLHCEVESGFRTEVDGVVAVDFEQGAC